MAELEVVLESAPKRSFACALWFPGWFGHGTSADAAIERLLAYRERYAAIAAGAGVKIPARLEVVVVEEIVGDATTEFGAPGKVASAERDATQARLVRLRELHAACRSAFEAAAASAPEALRKGPRGGGRDTSKVMEHVLGAERAYASKLTRAAWPEAYYLRRSAYHYADHLWEIEDRTP